MAADNLVTQGAGTSATIILTLLNQDNLIFARYGLSSLHYLPYVVSVFVFLCSFIHWFICVGAIIFAIVLMDRICVLLARIICENVSPVFVHV